MVPTLPYRKTATLSVIIAKNLGQRGKKTTHFENQMFHRRAATHTYAGFLITLRKTSLQMWVHNAWINTKRIKNKFVQLR
jgi:hypothetical protein